MRTLLIVFLFVLLSPSAAMAAPVLKPISLEEISPAELQQRINTLKESADKFANNKSKQKQFQADITALTARLTGQSDFANFSASDQLEIVNAYESLRARVSDAAGSQRICEQVQRTGTHMTKTICLTKAERIEAKLNAQGSMIELQRRTQDVGRKPEGSESP